MMITRYAKIVMVACLAIFCLLVVFNNLTDYDTNHLFVKRVLSMDTTFAGNPLLYRSVTHPVLTHFSYWLIILGEAIAGILFLAGAIRLWQVRSAPAPEFNGAKGLVVVGALAAFIVWFFLFMVIAGEWFVMWQSTSWNAQQAAFRLYVTVLVVLIFVNQADGDLPKPAKPAKPAPAKRAPAKRSPAKRASAEKPAPAKKRTPTRRRIDKGRRRTDTE